MALIEMKNIEVTFGTVNILKNVNFTLQAGEIHALVGENGAGKSSLMKALIGLYRFRKGEILIDGKKVNITSPRDAIDNGITMIHQELQLASHLTVSENIFLGREKSRGLALLDRKKMNEEVKEILETLDADIDPDDIVGDLGIAKQQMVAIAKAISTGAKVIIMDESTTALSDEEAEHLFELLKELKKTGVTFIIITHRLEEVIELSDNVTIMRDGMTIAHKPTEELTIDKIVTLMVGRDIDDMFPKVEGVRGKKTLEVKNITVDGVLDDISFEAYAGEVLGIAGLMGAGRTEISEVIFGVRKCDSGEIYINGELKKITSPQEAIDNRIAFVTEDRRGSGIVPHLRVDENMILPIIDQVSKLGVVNKRRVRKLSEDYIEKLQIKVKDPCLPVDVLSAGNQQ